MVLRVMQDFSYPLEERSGIVAPAFSATLNPKTSIFYKKCRDFKRHPFLIAVLTVLFQDG